jgi:NAD(P)H-hydrate epimerase
MDLPSGIDATTGRNAGGLRCGLTVTFGTIKRGHLVAREDCGDVVVVDIGLGVHARAAAERARLATASWFAATLPPIGASAHKGTRKKIAIVGGAGGMAGAAILASRAALRSGAGMVRCVVAPESLPAVQEAEPAALGATWPEDDASAASIADWADALLIGPGLGRESARALVERLLGAFRGPVVLDADALNAFAGDVAALARALDGREALLTPHPAEFGRLAGLSVEQVLDDRFELPRTLAAESRAAVLLKGVPTVVAAPGGSATIVAEGTPVLATGGSGDVLTGMIAAWLAQLLDADAACRLAVFLHGAAGDLAAGHEGRVSMIAGDLINHLGAALEQLTTPPAAEGRDG